MVAGEENNAKIVNAFLRDVTATLLLRLNSRLTLMVMMEVMIMIATTMPLCRYEYGVVAVYDVHC